MDAKESAAGRMNSPRGPEVADPCSTVYTIEFRNRQIEDILKWS